MAETTTKSGLQSLLAGTALPQLVRVHKEWDLPKFQVENYLYQEKLLEYLRRLLGRLSGQNILNELFNTTNITEIITNIINNNFPTAGNPIIDQFTANSAAEVETLTFSTDTNKTWSTVLTIPANTIKAVGDTIRARWYWDCGADDLTATNDLALKLYNNTTGGFYTATTRVHWSDRSNVLKPKGTSDPNTNRTQFEVHIEGRLTELSTNNSTGKIFITGFINMAYEHATVGVDQIRGIHQIVGTDTFTFDQTAVNNLTWNLGVNNRNSKTWEYKLRQGTLEYYPAP